MGEALERDPALLAAAFARWLAARLEVDEVGVSDISRPAAGYSNETVFVTAHWHDGAAAHEDELVLRIEPTARQLFRQPSAVFQARMLEALGRHPGTPVPAVTFTETDPTVLGAPFFVMPRVPGRIPSDVPSWHQHGWTTGLGAEGISTMYDSGLAALAALHRIDWRDGFDFLAAGPTSRGLPAYLAEVERSYDWAAPSLRFEPDDLERALRWVLEHAPDDRAEGIVWGDARLGNLIFGDDLGVAAMLDWETACLGPPGIDLGWWLMFEDFLCAAQGIVPLPGTPGRDEIVRRYEALGGGRITGLDYYEVLACVTMSIINSRLGDLLQRRHALSDERAGTWARRTIAMATRRLDRILD